MLILFKAKSVLIRVPKAIGHKKLQVVHAALKHTENMKEFLGSTHLVVGESLYYLMLQCLHL